MSTNLISDPMKEGKIAFGVLTLLALLLACQKVQRIPHGWRVPTDFETREETGDDWRSEDSNRFLKATGDFDGDGRIDYAQFLVRRDGSQFGVFVSLSSVGLDTMILASEVSGPGLLTVMGISKVPPGSYETEEYSDSTRITPDKLILANDGINFFKEGSANVFLVWDAPRKKFKIVQMSD